MTTVQADHAAPIDALIQRLQSSRTPTPVERASLSTSISQSVAVGRNYTLASEGEELGWTYLIEAGWFLRSRSSRGGQRHSMKVLLPGDLVAPFAMVHGRAGWDVVSATAGRVSLIAPSALLDLTGKHPELMATVYAGEVGAMERVLLYGCHGKVRTAADRVLFFLLELWTRLRVQGLAGSNSFDLPLSQGHLADVCGLSLVHTNKSIGQLRQRGLVETFSRQIRFPDLDRAIEQTGFDHPSLTDALS